MLLLLAPSPLDASINKVLPLMWRALFVVRLSSSSKSGARVG